MLTNIHDFRSTSGAQGLLVDLVQNIFAHKGEGGLLPEHPQVVSCRNSPRKSISGDVCGNRANQGEEGELNTRERQGKKNDVNNVCF